MTVTITIRENYAAELRQRLQTSGISLGALGRKLNVDRAQVARWFNTRMQPRIDTVMKIERAVMAIQAENVANQHRDS